MQINACHEFRYEQVEQAIIQMIEKGVLLPGDKLPSLRKLKIQTGYSLSTINQAYLELESKGLIESRPRSGFFVRKCFRKIPQVPITPPQKLACKPVNRCSLIQKAMETVGQEDMVPLGLALPDDSLLPINSLGKIAASVMRNQAGRSMVYESVQGYKDLRSQISFRSLDTGSMVAPDKLIITSGALDAIILALRTVTNPHDNILIADPTYFSFLRILENLSLNAISVRSCPETGVIIEDIQKAIKRFNIAAALFIPNFSNPDGSLMPSSNKKELVKLLTKADIPIIEDDIYGDIYFTKNRPETLKTYDTKGLVLTCSSFSKTLAPGYRIGWLNCDRFFDKALRLKAAMNPHSATPTQIIIAQYLAQGKYDKHLKSLRAKIANQVSSMRNKVADLFMPDVCCSDPKGGMFLWLRLPQAVDSKKLFFKAREKKVGIIPGYIFSNQDTFNNYIRLGCGSPTTPSIENGLATVTQLIKEITDNKRL